jgi:hypothetical protein
MHLEQICFTKQVIDMHQKHQMGECFKNAKAFSLLFCVRAGEVWDIPTTNTDWSILMLSITKHLKRNLSKYECDSDSPYGYSDHTYTNTTQAMLIKRRPSFPPHTGLVRVQTASWCSAPSIASTGADSHQTTQLFITHGKTNNKIQGVPLYF